MARRPAKPVKAKPSKAAVGPPSGVVTGVPLKTKTWLRPYWLPLPNSGNVITPVRPAPYQTSLPYFGPSYLPRMYR